MTSQTPIDPPEVEKAKEIGQRIKFFRETMNWRQADLAERLNRDVGTISRWERGESLFESRRRVREISHATGVSPQWLLTGEGPMEAPGKRLGESMAREIARTYRSDAPAVNAEVLTQAIALVLQELQNRKATLPAPKIAAAVVEIYELAVTKGTNEVTVENVTPFVRLLLA